MSIGGGVTAVYVPRSPSVPPPRSPSVDESNPDSPIIKAKIAANECVDRSISYSNSIQSICLFVCVYNMKYM